MGQTKEGRKEQDEFLQQLRLAAADKTIDFAYKWEPSLLEAALYFGVGAIATYLVFALLKRTFFYVVIGRFWA